jgi:hypothetical protein
LAKRRFEPSGLIRQQTFHETSTHRKHSPATGLADHSADASRNGYHFPTFGIDLRFS